LGKFQHFFQYGADEDIAPNKYFSPEDYYASKASLFYNDGSVRDLQSQRMQDAVHEAGLNAWTHYTQWGASEGVDPSPAFDTSAYFDDKLAQLQRSDASWKEKDIDDVAQAFKEANLNPVQHYFLYGQNEGLTPTPTAMAAGNAVALAGVSEADMAYSMPAA
jgi:hypothetical protein